MGSYIIGGGTPGNFSSPGEEYVGFSSTGTTLVNLAANAAANTKGNWTNIGTASGALFHGVIVVIANGSTAGAGFAIDISFDNDVTTHIPNLYAEGNTGSVQYVYLPLNVQTVATANHVRGRVQSSTGSATINIGIIGLLNNDNQARTLWNNMFAETATTTGATQPGTADIAVGSPGSYADVDASASQSFGCILPCVTNGATGGDPGAIEPQLVTYATGNSGAEVAIATRPFSRSTASPRLAGNYGNVIYVPIASGTKVRAKASSASPGAGPSTLRIGYYGFY